MKDYCRTDGGNEQNKNGFRNWMSNIIYVIVAIIFIGVFLVQLTLA